MSLSVSELADRAQISPDTVRYYGRLGLLPETGRTHSGHRYYDEVALERLRFIKGAQWLELRLDEIAELLQLSDRGECPCGQAEAMLRQRIRVIDEHMDRLGEIRADLCRLLGSPSAASSPEGAAPAHRESLRASQSEQPDSAPVTQTGCSCCEDLGLPSAEQERQELQARRQAVEKRLSRLQGRHVEQPS